MGEGCGKWKVKARCLTLPLNEDGFVCICTIAVGFYFVVLINHFKKMPTEKIADDQFDHVTFYTHDSHNSVEARTHFPGSWWFCKLFSFC